MKLKLVLLLLVAAGASRANGEEKPLPRTFPETMGVSSKAILDFVTAADQQVQSMHSFILVRRGHVIAEGWWTPYAPEIPHSLFSLSKSFTSTAVGLVIAEHKLSLDDEILKFFPEDAPRNPSSTNLKAMRVRDLLRMSTGQQAEPRRTNDEPWTKTFLAQPVPFKPGTHFLYNTSGTYMLSAIVQKVTGQTVLDYLRPRLFEPLGITNPTWEKSPQGISTGGYGLSIRTEDIAKFGLLYLNRGKWANKQLIPESWVVQATALQTSNGSNPQSDWDQGYGYQFWRCRHDAYRGDGAFGQFCIVMPAQEVVLAITSGTRDMQKVLDLVWDRLLPGIGKSTLNHHDETHKQLVTKLAGLRIPPVQGSPAPPADLVKKTFTFPDNPRKLESITVGGGSDKGTDLSVRIAGHDSELTLSPNTWRAGRMMLAGPAATAAEQRVSVSGAWTAPNVLTAQVCQVETPFITTYEFTFKGDGVYLKTSVNVGFGRGRGGELVGKPR